MKQYESTRKSHCYICGKRLSEQTASGKIRWQLGHVDDSGIYCACCLMPKKSAKNQISARP
jgi:hypothetical protein